MCRGDPSYPDAPLFAGVTADRLRMAIGRACWDAGVPHFGPHALRHRRISLWHRQGILWAEIGDRVGQRSKLATADTYSHALIDSREVDRARLVAHVRGVHTPVRTSGVKESCFTGAFEPSSAHFDPSRCGISLLVGMSDVPNAPVCRILVAVRTDFGRSWAVLNG